MDVFVARHGETDWNREGRYQGRLDVSKLSELGVRQAEALARALSARGIERIVSSPLQRCVETARAVAHQVDRSIDLDDRLLEIGHGTWEGRLRAHVECDDAERFASWRLHPERVEFPGGESLSSVLERWRTFASSLDGKNTVAIITHDVLVRLAILDAAGAKPGALWEPRVVNAGFARFDVRGRAWRILDECVELHLAGCMADSRVQAL